MLTYAVALAVTAMQVATHVTPIKPPDGWRGQETIIEGVVHVQNPSTGVEPDVIVETRPEWNLDEDASGVVFGEIDRALRDAQGTTYLLDGQLNQIHVVSAAGDFIRSIGRPGEGPGEFRGASGMTFLGDSVLCVSQEIPSRLVMLTVTGRAAEDYPLPRELLTAMIKGCRSVDGDLVLYLAQVTAGETSLTFRTFFQRLAADGTAGRVYWENVQKADLANITFDEQADAAPVAAVSPDGRVFVYNGWDAYEIETVSPAGARRVFGREYEPLPRPAWQMSMVKVQIDKRKMSSTTKISKTARSVVQIVPRDDGRVWVLSSRGENEAPEGCMAAFDEFDRGGHLLRRVNVKGRYQPGRDALFVSGDHVIVVTNGGLLGGSDAFKGDEVNPETYEVHCYELLDAASPQN